MREWGIVHHQTPDTLHRGPMSEVQARLWIREWEEDGGRPIWLLVHREVGAWERVDAHS
jgi:hypothetical protein